jgi:protein gp37
MAATEIEWSDAVWNPIRGCSRVSDGCTNCYAMRQAHRFAGGAEDQGPYYGLTTIRRGKVDWSGVVRFVPEMLDAPLRWRKPRRVFTNSMSDLFHESLTNEKIAAVFGVMAAAPQHTFQVLTKRSKRAREWFQWAAQLHSCSATGVDAIVRALSYYAHLLAPSDATAQAQRTCHDVKIPWPLSNVWLGVSAEDQQRADERIPELLECPAAVRFVSLEPLLGPIDIGIETARDYLEPFQETDPMLRRTPRIDWVIVGSESGHGARPMDLAWAESLREQCAASGVAFFTKQIANPHDRKGGDPQFWPGGPWPREFPEVAL